MSKIILYGGEATAPVRAVMLTLHVLEVDYEFREIDLDAGENRTEDFLKKNPQHTIPVLEDNGQFLWDSHAIMVYLVKKYAKNDDLYPEDFYKCAVVDQRLHFDSGVLFPSLRNAASPIFHENEKTIPQYKIDAIYDGYNFLETFLENDYLAGSTLTLADFSAVSTVTNLEALAPLDDAKYPKIRAWINRLGELPYYQQLNAKGAAVFAKVLKQKLVKN